MESVAPFRKEEKMKTFRLGLSAIVVAAVVSAMLPDRPQAQTSEEIPTIAVPKQQVTVVDGNTLRIDGKRLRLAGVQAPALRQQCVRDERLEPCGEQAAQALQKIVDLAVKPLECRIEAAGLGVCLVDGRDVAEALVLQGRAISYGDRYVEAEEQAKKANLGLWSSAWVPPDQWRDGHRLPEEMAARSRALAGEKKPEQAQVGN